MALPQPLLHTAYAYNNSQRLSLIEVKKKAIEVFYTPIACLQPDTTRSARSSPL